MLRTIRAGGLFQLRGGGAPRLAWRGAVTALACSFSVVFSGACDSRDGHSGDAGASAGGSSPGGAGSGAPGSDRSTTTEPIRGAGVFGEPEESWTLPAGEGELPRLAFPDVQAAFPEVNWATLDRLYVPAGHYGSILLGNLPERTVDDPLVITNQGGQVRIGGGGFGYNLNLQGGKGWVLTGRYDALSATGHQDFRGHLEGDYASSQGTYGFLIDDEFSREGLSGIYVGSGASDFEIDAIEITRVEFAGISAKTDDDGDAMMRNVHLHDVYVHDVGSEGIYFGSTQPPPQHPFENLHIHDNRFLRTGTEALQVGQLGDGCEIHHNVIGPAAIRWRSAFSRYQDGNVQFGQRYGSSSFHHNVVIGAGDLFVEFFPQSVEGDRHGRDDTVTFRDNYFADSSRTGVYTHKQENSVTVVFEDNTFTGFVGGYGQVYPEDPTPVAVFGVGSGTLNPHILRNNQWEAPWPFIQWVFDSVSVDDNPETDVERVVFRDFMGPELEENFRLLEWWTDVATLHPEQLDVTYSAGSFVMHGGLLYRALRQNHGRPPDESPQDWERLPDPVDDVRLDPNSPSSHRGIR